jgi:hypothetical protein
MSRLSFKSLELLSSFQSNNKEEGNKSINDPPRQEFKYVTMKNQGFIRLAISPELSIVVLGNDRISL